MTTAIMIYAAAMQTVAVLLLVVQSRFMWRADIRGANPPIFEIVQESQVEDELVQEDIIPRQEGTPDASQLHEVMKSSRLSGGDFSEVSQPYNLGMYL